jgi:hypothetical protein
MIEVLGGHRRFRRLQAAAIEREANGGSERRGGEAGVTDDGTHERLRKKLCGRRAAGMARICLRPNDASTDAILGFHYKRRRTVRVLNQRRRNTFTLAPDTQSNSL